ncbi:methylmalonyl-CoA mutase [Priestia megaterium]|nr:methylmalonyl-CoA mutase [Priestia megaterium]
MKMNSLSFHEFKPTPQEDWIQEAEKQNSHLIEKLTLENIFLKPLYREEDIKDLLYLNELPGQGSFVRGSRKTGYIKDRWEITQQVDSLFAATCNELLKEGLHNGQTTAAFKLNKASILGKDPEEVPFDKVGRGVFISQEEDIEYLFRDISLKSTTIFVNTGYTSLPLLAYIQRYCNKKQIPLEDLKGTIGMDPLGTLAAYSFSPIETTHLYDHMVKSIEWAKEYNINVKTIYISSQPYHDSGANAVQELAFGLATAVQYIDECLKRNIPLHHVLPHLTFSFSTSSHLFMEISKLRAFRLLWTNVVRAFSPTIEIPAPFIHASTSDVTFSKEDVHTNIIRGTVQAFAAIIGGADSLHIEPYNSLLEDPTLFSHRIARNTHLILEKESHLTKVIDPAGGSWYVESYTHELAQQAWSLFREIERCGGMEACLKNGMIQKQVEDTLQRQKQQIETRAQRMVGVTHYVAKHPIKKKQADNKEKNYQEYQKLVAKNRQKYEKEVHSSQVSIDKDTDLIKDGMTIGMMMEEWQRSSAYEQIQPFTKWRKGQAFEEIRLRTCDLSVGIIQVNQSAVSKKRTAIAQSLFESGGFQCEIVSDLYSYVDIADWVNDGKHHAYVVCGEDEMVEKMIGKVMPYFLQNTVYMYVVGEDDFIAKREWQHRGIVDIIHSQTNAIQCFEQLLQLLEVNADV